jgi:hypothetical protein
VCVLILATVAYAIETMLLLFWFAVPQCFKKNLIVGRIFLMFTAVGLMSTQDFEGPFLGPWALGAQPPSRKASHLDTCGRW